MTDEPKAVHTCDTCVDHATGAACHTCKDFSMWIPRRAETTQNVLTPKQAAEAAAALIEVTSTLPGPVLRQAEQKLDPLRVQEGGSHYKDMKIQPIEYIHANGIPFAEGCAIKYLTRWRAKGGVEDLKKARHFIDLLIELETR